MIYSAVIITSLNQTLNIADFQNIEICKIVKLPKNVQNYRNKRRKVKYTYVCINLQLK